MSAEAYAICAMLLCACTLYIGIRCGWELHKEKVIRDVHDHPPVARDPTLPKRPPTRSQIESSGDPLAPFRVGSSKPPFPRSATTNK